MSNAIGLSLSALAGSGANFVRTTSANVQTLVYSRLAVVDTGGTTPTAANSTNFGASGVIIYAIIVHRPVVVPAQFQVGPANASGFLPGFTILTPAAGGSDDVVTWFGPEGCLWRSQNGDCNVGLRYQPDGGVNHLDISMIFKRIA